MGQEMDEIRTALNNASLWLGDCLEIMPQLESESFDLVLADLPYGVTACSWDCVIPLDLLWLEYKRLVKPEGAILLTAAQPFAWQLCASNPAWFKYEIVWEKPNGTNPMLVKKQPFRVHEQVLVFYEKQPTYNPQMTYGHSPYSSFHDETKSLGEVYGDDTISRHRENTDGSRYPRSVQRFPQVRGGHPTQKPVELLRWLIRTYSNPGEIILDNVMGWGSTGVAAVQEDRKFVGIEKKQDYFAHAVRRIERAANDH